MARIEAKLSPGARLADYLKVGFLALQCSLAAVRKVLVKHQAKRRRLQGLPHKFLL